MCEGIDDFLMKMVVGLNEWKVMGWMEQLECEVMVVVGLKEWFELEMMGMWWVWWSSWSGS